MAYPAVSDLKTYLPTSSSSEDTTLTIILNAAIAWVEKWCGHVFVAEDDETIYVVPEYPSILDARHTLLIRDHDIQTVTSITNGDGETVSSDDYRLLPASGPPYYKIELSPVSGLRWWRGSDGLGVVTIVCGSLGYSADVPNDVNLAILQFAAWAYKGRTTGAAGPVSTATRAGLMIPASDVPKPILSLLAPYRRVKG